MSDRAAAQRAGLRRRLHVDADVAVGEVGDERRVGGEELSAARRSARRVPSRSATSMARSAKRDLRDAAAHRPAGGTRRTRAPAAARRRASTVDAARRSAISEQRRAGDEDSEDGGNAMKAQKRSVSRRACAAPPTLAPASAAQTCRLDVRRRLKLKKKDTPLGNGMCSDSTRCRERSSAEATAAWRRRSTASSCGAWLVHALHRIGRGRRVLRHAAASSHGRYRAALAAGWSPRRSSTRPTALLARRARVKEALPGLRRRAARRYRRLPDVRVPADAAARCTRAACRRVGRCRWHRDRAAEQRLWLRRAGREDRVITSSPAFRLLEHRRALPVRRRRCRRSYNARRPARAERARLRPDRLRLSVAHADAARADARARRRLGRAGRARSS